MSLFTEALNEVRPFRRLHGIDLKSYEFGSVFVDPPRAGMDPDTCELTCTCVTGVTVPVAETAACSGPRSMAKRS